MIRILGKRKYFSYHNTRGAFFRRPAPPKKIFIFKNDRICHFHILSWDQEVNMIDLRNARPRFLSEQFQHFYQNHFPVPLEENEGIGYYGDFTTKEYEGNTMSDDATEGLFSDGNIIREAIRKEFSRFDLKRILEILSYRMKQGMVAEWKDTRTAVESLMRIAGKKGGLEPLMDLFFHVETFPQYHSLLPYKSFLKEGLAHIIIERLGDQVWDFISYEVHGAEFLIFLHRYEEALEACRRYLSRKGEHPMVRQLMSYAQMMEGDDEEAVSNLTLGIMINPLRLKESYVLSPMVRNWIQNFQQNIDDADDELLDEIMTDWFRLLEEGVLVVSYDRDCYDYLSDRLEGLPCDSGASVRAVSFLNLFYVAESLRITGAALQQVAQYRIRMKRDFPGLYEKYMTFIS